MYVILSQKIDAESTYEDVLFKTYHYPSRYAKQLHPDDTFIYYQGDRRKKENRYYFGVGVIQDIVNTDDENYYATLTNCKRFPKKVPIYLPDNKGYIEQIGYESVRKHVNPPWQSSIRPISKDAFDLIISASGMDLQIETQFTIDELKDSMKDSIRKFYREDNLESISDIVRYSTALEEKLLGKD